MTWLLLLALVCVPLAFVAWAASQIVAGYQESALTRLQTREEAAKAIAETEWKQ